MKNPYPENQRAEDTTTGGERLVTKWYDNDGRIVVVIQKERPYFCVGFNDRQLWLLK